MNRRTSPCANDVPSARALRVDLHVHTRASAGPALPALALTGCPESHSEPERVYALARRRGMDAVAITDHDTIAGATALVDAGYPDVIVGEEVSARFPEDGCAAHVLLWGLSPAQHDEIGLLSLRDDIRAFAAWVRQAGLPHALAHPLHAQNSRLTLQHLEELALLFRGFEVLNGAHGGLRRRTERFVDALTPTALTRLAQRHSAALLYDPNAPRLRTAGSDDHALLNVGRTWTAIDLPPGSARASLGEGEAAEAVLAGLRRADARVGGAGGSPEVLAHQIMTVAAQHAVKALPAPARADGRLAASRLCRLAGANIAPPSRAALAMERVRARLAGVRQRRSGFLRTLSATLEDALNDHPAIARSARRDACDPPIADHARFARFADDFTARLARRFADDFNRAWRARRAADLADAGLGLLAAHLAMAPYALAMFYQRKDAGLHAQTDRALTVGWPGERCLDPEPLRSAQRQPFRLALFTDAATETNGVARFLRDLADHARERRWTLRIFCAPAQTSAALAPPFAPLRPIASFEAPGYPGLRVGVPPALPLLRAAQRFRPHAIHVSTPGPTGLLGVAAGAALRVPVLGVHHTDFPAYVERLLGEATSARLARAGLRLLYLRFARVMARSAASVEQIRALGVERKRIVVIPPGVDAQRFSPTHRDHSLWRSLGVDPDAVVFLYVGRLSREKNTEALADIWTRAHRRAAAQGLRAALVVAGDGPERANLERQLGGVGARFLGEAHGEALSRLYASADVFLFPSETETLGQVVMEAQASGLPAIVSNRGGPATMVRDGATGFVAPATDAGVWVDRALRLARSDALRRRMGAAARREMERRSLARSLDAFYAAHREAARFATSSDRSAGAACESATASAPPGVGASVGG